MPSGTVKLLNKEGGFGFIAPDDGSRDVFFQLSSVNTPDHSLSEGQRVEYQMSMGRKGPEAVQITSSS
jgi:cold shock protein